MLFASIQTDRVQPFIIPENSLSSYRALSYIYTFILRQFCEQSQRKTGYNFWQCSSGLNNANKMIWLHKDETGKIRFLEHSIYLSQIFHSDMKIKERQS